MHTAGDEIVLMLTSQLVVEYSDGFRHGTSSLEAGHEMVAPKCV